MCVTTSAPASSKTPVQDISYPVVYVDSAILIPFPKEKTKWIVTSTFKNNEVKKKEERYYPTRFHNSILIIKYSLKKKRFGWPPDRFSYS
jgi:hypothetical protein